MLLSFTQARDATLVFSILDEAAAWLTERGIRQWPTSFSAEPSWRSARITSYIDAGQTWIAQADDGEPAAVFTLAGPDPHYAEGWPSNPDDALYLYRMATRRAYAGHGIGAQIVNWAALRADALGKKWLRLDCHRDNTAIQRYYEKQGFERVGTMVVDIDPGAEATGETYTRGSGALYQRPAGTMHTPDQGNTPDRYDPTGEAAIWQQAAELVLARQTDPAETTSIADPWNTALDQASRTLENEASGIRQAHGVWYRQISGQHAR